MFSVFPARSEEESMKIGISLPVRELENDLEAIKAFAQAADELGFAHLRVPAAAAARELRGDHVRQGREDNAGNSQGQGRRVEPNRR